MASEEALDRADRLVELTREEGADGFVVLRLDDGDVDILQTGDHGGEQGYKAHVYLAGFLLDSIAETAGRERIAIANEAHEALRDLEYVGVSEYGANEGER